MQERSVLAWIIGFKAFKAIALTLLGVILVTTRHDDPADLMTRLAMTIHLPLSSTLFDRALNFALSLSVRKQIALGITAFGYAALMGSEGTALYLRNRGPAGSPSPPPARCSRSRSTKSSETFIRSACSSSPSTSAV